MWGVSHAPSGTIAGSNELDDLPNPMSGAIFPRSLRSRIALARKPEALFPPAFTIPAKSNALQSCLRTFYRFVEAGAMT